MARDGAQWATLKKYIDYLDAKGIKAIAYTALGHITGQAMSTSFKDEYVLTADIYAYDDETGIGKKIQSTTAIPKSDKTDNPDTVSDGKQTYIDITHPDAMKWYLNTVWGEMMKLGIDGLKVDFSESLPNEGVYRDININGTRYEKVYIKLRWHDPSMFGATEPHHAYAAYYVSAVNKYMNEKADLREDDDGFIVLARGGGIGLQRNPYMLAGDQTRRFKNLSTQLAALINSGISGISFVTYDMGGYAYYGTPYHYYGGQVQELDENNGKLTLFDFQDAEEYESEIFIRSMQYTIFGSVVKTHGDVRHVYQMTDEVQELAPLYMALHNELSAYRRELSQIACDTGMPLVRHMILEYQNDPNVADVDDQYMYGDALLVAPILTCNTKTQSGKQVLDYASVVTRTVYLPAGEWIDLNTGETIVSTGQTITVSANLAKVPVYLNTASEHAEALKTVFAGETWSAIKVLANAK
jgi:alpha-glucosidase (family GH31 glycosyl hydrolase)